MNSFEGLKYRSQLRLLTQAAHEILKRYSVNDYKLKFINHGENATFKVIEKNKSYLLRLHRSAYHSKKALSEEILFLKYLNENSDLTVQTPVLSKNKRFIELHNSEYMPQRYCSLLTWLDGRMKYGRFTIKDFYSLGVFTAKLHFFSNYRNMRNRRYWTPEGLLGEKATFGSLDDLKGVFKSRFKVVEDVRKLSRQKISDYKIKNPKKHGLIHADLHFGNIIWNKGQIIPIDFDDCGYGSFLYDFSVTLSSSRYFFRKIGKSKELELKEAYFLGYSSLLDLNNNDLEHLPYFILTRDLAMLAWIYARRDNPRLYKYFLERKDKIISDFKVILKNGVEPIF